MEAFYLRISFWALASLLIFSQLSQAQSQEQYQSGRVSKMTFSKIAEEEAKNPPIIMTKRVGNEESVEYEERDAKIPEGSNIKTFDIKAPKNQQKSGKRDKSPAPVQNFEGLNDSDTSIPPDTHGAVGPNHIMVTLNTQVRILNRSGGTISTVSLQGFWGSVSNNAFDPKVYYDPYDNRWIVVAADDARSNDSGILIAASETSDPTGNWNRYFIEGDPSNTLWFDYPGLGFNNNWVVVTGNMFPINSGSSAVNLYYWSKQDLYDGVSNLTANRLQGVSSSTLTMMPAIMYDNNINRIYMLQSWNGSSGSVRFSKMQENSSGTSMSFSEIGFLSVSDTWAFSPSETNSAPQSGSSEKINNGGSRILDAVYRAESGTFWACQNAFLPTNSPDRTIVQWWEIDPDLNNDGNDGDTDVLQFGRIDGDADNKFYAYPSLAVNAVGDMLIGYTSFSSSQFASAEYSVHEAEDAAGTTQPTYQYKAGEGPYFKTFGGDRNRWGDYSATCVDPENDLNIWTLQEIAKPPQTSDVSNPGRWSVHWALVTFDGTTAINAVSVADNSLCVDESVNVNFIKVGTFASGNIFTVELSDANGAFGSPTVIATGVASPISVNFPSNTPASDNYRVRVRSSNPVLVSEPSGPFQISTPPTDDASAISIQPTGADRLQVTWDNGNGEGRLVLVKEGSDFTPADFPNDGQSYSASSIYGLGSLIGEAYVVYRGSNNSVIINGLDLNTTYYVAVIEFSCDPPNYRLASVPSQSSTITNLAAELNRALKVYPNPTSNELRLELPGISQKITYQLYDKQGKLLEERVLENTQETVYDVSRLPKGVYQLKIMVNGESISKKLVIR